MTAPQMLYLEDFAVGRTFVTGTANVTLEAAKTFAAEFDPQPFHLDEEAARRSVFGRLTVSGWYTASLSMRLLVKGELRAVAGGLIGLGGEVSWPRAVSPGDTLRVETEIVDVRPSQTKLDRGIVTARNQTLNQNDEPVQIMLVKMLVLRRPPT